MHNKSDTELCASWVGASYGSRSPHQIADPWDFNFFAGAQAHPGSPAAHPHTPWNNHALTFTDEISPGGTQMLFRTHVFFPEQLPISPGCWTYFSSLA